MRRQSDDEIYLGMRPGDLEGKPYARYWQPEMAPLSADAREALLRGPEAGELALEPQEAHRLLEPGYLPMETGYARLPNGQLFVAVLTKMPRTSGAMIDWWMHWHAVEKERYKLWHPRAHLWNKTAAPVPDGPDVSDRARYVGATHLVTEYIGDALVEIAISFVEPAGVGLDAASFARARVSTAVCGRVRLRRRSIEIGTLVHLIRETEEGVEMRSRFWLGAVALPALSGAHPLNRLLATPRVARLATPRSLGRDMLVHCASEMGHLASFLPDLYADYHRG